jgi:glycosyltransferase involved in cell wall biosynthesis
MQPRKIAFYTSGESCEGLERNALRFIQWLGTEENELMLIASAGSVFADAAAEQGIPLALVERPHYYLNLRRAFQISWILKKGKIKVLFIIRPRDILMAAIVKMIFFRKLKLIYFQQSFLQLKKHPVLYTFLFYPYDAWIAPSSGIARQTLKMSHFNPAKMLIIPPCIDVENFVYDTLTKKAARKILGLPPSGLIMGTLGRHHRSKHQDFFIRAVQLLQRNNLKIDLLIMGDTANNEELEYLEFLKDLARECKIEKHIFFRPFSKKLTTFFRAADIFVMNRIPQPFDLIVPKAMASGTVVVAPFSEINTELLARGKYGMLYRQNSIEDFTGKMTHLITEPDLRGSLAEASKKMIHEKFDKTVGCRKVNNLLDRLLE